MRVYYNALVRTMDPATPVAEAFAVDSGEFVAIGGNDDVLNLAQGSRGAQKIDLGGLPVFPGFIDGHTHVMWVGESLERVDLSKCRSIEEVRSRLRERAAELGPGQWVLGWGWHQERFAERRDPVAADIDGVIPGNPAYLIRECTHTALVNSLALEMAGVGANTPDPVGGKIVRDDSGVPVGLLHETAMQLVSRILPAPDERAKRETLKRAMLEMLKLGITSVHTIDFSCEEAYRSLHTGGELPLRVYMDQPMSTMEEISAITEPTGSGDDWLRMGSVKFWADGAFGPRTAAVREPYADDPGNTGLLVYEPGELARLAAAAARKGRQISIHALGDRALDVTLDALEQATTAPGEPVTAGSARGGRRDRVVHCGLTDAASVARMKSLGAVADLQPCFIPHEVHWMPGRVGPERRDRMYAFKSLVDAGICCTAGSDAPVDPLDPMIGIFGAVARASIEGYPPGGWVPGQKVPVEEAVRMYTVNGAFAEYAEARKGMIRRGYLADFVVLSSDLFTVAEGDIPGCRVLATVVGGGTAWLDGKAAPALR
ncbi:MAG: amidohydrolase [Firmicutes bacterium]|nr:amidohydrolase [Bacillota bacterium]